jgi:hypothetical protein
VAYGYNLARTEKFYIDRNRQGGGVSSVTEDEGAHWKKLWATKAVGKMKINLWQFAHDCLATGFQLCRCHIPASSSSICGREESAEHVFISCQFANEVCQEIKLSYPMHRLHES